MAIPLRVLLVEDSEDDAALILRELQRGGYEVTSQRVYSRELMKEALTLKQWDLVICDYSMPNFSGTDALKMLREKDPDIPFIYVSGTIGEETAVAAMRMGAQDYVMKDSLKRLLPAIRRELHETKEKREHRQLEQRVEQLQKFEAIGRLAGGIAHDFNNVLGVILGWAHLGCEEAPPDSRLCMHFQSIRDQAQKASGLTQQLLAFARRQVLQPRVLSLNDLVTSMTGLLRTALGEMVALKTNLDPTLYSTRADQTQLEQVVMNLCLNARDAMPNGGRLIVETTNMEIGEDFVRVHSYGRTGTFVVLSVSDSGIGMDRATTERIFEPFFTTKELGRGTGLGLSTVYGIVKQHDGFLNVYSELGKGTTFRIYLPATSAPAQPRVDPIEEKDGKGTETILVAEDHDDLRAITSEALTSLGYCVIEAEDGETAVQIFKERGRSIDLLILDVVMPRLNGPAAYAEMSAVKAGVPVIFTTGHTEESASLTSFIEAGGVCLQKPYSPKTLSRLVRSRLNRRKQD